MGSSVGSQIGERIIFSATNPYNVSKVIDAIVDGVRKRKKPTTVEVKMDEPPTREETILSEQMEVLRGCDNVGIQLRGLQALKKGEAEFEEFLKTL